MPRVAGGGTGNVDFRAYRGNRADQQRGRASPAPRGAMAEDQLRDGQRGRQPIRGEHHERGGDVPTARPERAGVPYALLPSAPGWDRAATIGTAAYQSGTSMPVSEGKTFHVKGPTHEAPRDRGGVGAPPVSRDRVVG